MLRFVFDNIKLNHVREHRVHTNEKSMSEKSKFYNVKLEIWKVIWKLQFVYSKNLSVKKINVLYSYLLRWSKRIIDTAILLKVLKFHLVPALLKIIQWVYNFGRSLILVRKILSFAAQHFRYKFSQNPLMDFFYFNINIYTKF